MANAPRTVLSGIHLPTLAALSVAALAAGNATAGGLLLYEVGSEDTGLASAGYAARAQDASTVFTNPAGMTLLDGTQVTAGAQLLYSDLKFSPGRGTSPELGGGNGGKSFGFDGWFPGGGAFVSYSASDDLKLGFALTGNFGLSLDYADNWVGRYYADDVALVGASVVPAIAYRVNDKLSLGASVNAMYGYVNYKTRVNNLIGADGSLKLTDREWGFGVNVGAMFETQPGTRIGVTYSSKIDLDFNTGAEFSGLGPGLEALLGSRGLLNAPVDLGMTVPQQFMGSVYSELDRHWALLASIGWQDWSEFGRVDVSVDSSNPTSLTTQLDYKDTWHAALGGQYRVNDPWRINFGVAYDSAFQDDPIDIALPANSQWRFGFGAQDQHSESFGWGFSVEYIYGGTLPVNVQSLAPVPLGGRGNVVGGYNATGVLVMGANFNWAF